MIKKVKSNNLITFALLILCLIFIFNPKVYANSCLNAISVWALNVLPVLFPFFVLTRLIVSLSPPKKSVLDKPFKTFYNSPAGSSFIFVLSVLSGYPMGAKLISTMNANGQVSKEEAESMLSYCSISGPMFIVGTVGVGILLSFKAGVIILISNILACMVNGFIFRLKKDKSRHGDTMLDNENSHILDVKSTSNILADCVYDALISILIVGAFICISFLIIDVLKNLKIINRFSLTFAFITNNKIDCSVFEAVFCGIIEITRGAIELNACNISLSLKTILASGLIGFGGISVFMQSNAFIKNLGIKQTRIIKQKFSQGILSLIIALPFALVLL